MKTLATVLFGIFLTTSLSTPANAESAKARATENGRIFGQVVYCEIEQERLDKLGQAIVDDFSKLAVTNDESHAANEAYLAERKKVANEVSANGTKAPEKCEEFLAEFSDLEGRLLEDVAKQRAEEAAKKIADEEAKALEKAKKEIEEQKKAEEAEEDEGMGFFGWLIFLIIYFVPTGLAKVKNHEYINFIVIVNLLTGWTGLGWLYALKTALENKKKEGGEEKAEPAAEEAAPAEEAAAPAEEATPAAEEEKKE